MRPVEGTDRSLLEQFSRGVGSRIREMGRPGQEGSPWGVWTLSSEQAEATEDLSRGVTWGDLPFYKSPRLYVKKESQGARPLVGRHLLSFKTESEFKVPHLLLVPTLLSHAFHTWQAFSTASVPEPHFQNCAVSTPRSEQQRISSSCGYKSWYWVWIVIS